MLPIIITDTNNKDKCATVNYTLDCAFGSGENDFELVVQDEDFSGGELIYIDGTEYGGIIDDIKIDTSTGKTTYTGRTWHGILTCKVIEPDQGQAYYTFSGSVTAAIRTIVERCGLSQFFTVLDGADVAITYQAKRYDNAYNVLCEMLELAGCTLLIKKSNGKCELKAVAEQTITNIVDSDLVDFVIETKTRPVNHLICLGQGELEKREVIHLFADEHGNISGKQTYFGKDEVAITYDYSSSENLEKDGIKKLKEFQDARGNVDVEFYGTSDTYRIGDKIFAREQKTGTSVTARIKKKIVTVQNGIIKVKYEIGVTKIQTKPTASDVQSSFNVLFASLKDSVAEMQENHEQIQQELDAYRQEAAGFKAAITHEIDEATGTITQSVEKRFKEFYQEITSIQQTAEAILLKAKDAATKEAQAQREATLKIASDTIDSKLKEFKNTADSNYVSFSRLKQEANAINSTVSSSLLKQNEKLSTFSTQIRQTADQVKTIIADGKNMSTMIKQTFGGVVVGKTNNGSYIPDSIVTRQAPEMFEICRAVSNVQLQRVSGFGKDRVVFREPGKPEQAFTFAEVCEALRYGKVTRYTQNHGDPWYNGGEKRQAQSLYVKRGPVVYMQFMFTWFTIQGGETAYKKFTVPEAFRPNSIYHGNICTAAGLVQFFVYPNGDAKFCYPYTGKRCTSMLDSVHIWQTDKF